MSAGIILLLVCLGALVVVWVGLDGIEISGALAAGLICILVGALAIDGAPAVNTAHFWVSLAFIVAGALVALSAIRRPRAMKEFSAAICVAIALVSGFYAIYFLT